MVYIAEVPALTQLRTKADKNIEKSHYLLSEVPENVLKQSLIVIKLTHEIIQFTWEMNLKIA